VAAKYFIFDIINYISHVLRLKSLNWNGISAIIALFGFIIIIFQLIQNKKITRTKFEDSLSNEYRNIIEKLPVLAMLGKEIPDLSETGNVEAILKEINPAKKRRQEKILSRFYRYFDLCNEQVFLMMKGRISKATWEEWQSGIKTNFRRTSFMNAFDLLIRNQETKTFIELEFLIIKRFDIRLDLLRRFRFTKYHCQFKRYCKNRLSYIQNINS